MILNGNPAERQKKASVINKFSKDRWLYLMLLPGILYFMIFKYLPMWGVLISFQDFQPYLGFFKSPWVGFSNFTRLFGDPDFGMLFRNTFVIAISNLIFFFPIPIILALMLNEVKNLHFKRVIQTVTYIPHFMSWVVIVGISYLLFTTEGGLINELIKWLVGEKIQFLMNNRIEN